MDADANGELDVARARDGPQFLNTTTNGHLPSPSISPRASPELQSFENERSPVGVSSFTERSLHATKNDYFLHVEEQERSVAPPPRRQSRETMARRRTSSNRMASPAGGEVQKLPPAKILELTSSPKFLPVRVETPSEEYEDLAERSPSIAQRFEESGDTIKSLGDRLNGVIGGDKEGPTPDTLQQAKDARLAHLAEYQDINGTMREERPKRPVDFNRTFSTPPNVRRKSASKSHSAQQHALNQGKSDRHIPPPLDLRDHKGSHARGSSRPPSSRPSLVSPMPSNLPLPPMSMPLHLQLELEQERPSPLYIHRSPHVEPPYESEEVKFERLLNFLRLPGELECVLGYGAFACLDSFLFIFTILPLRFIKAASILLDWALQNLVREAREIGGFVYSGVPRVWTREQQRRRASSLSKHEVDRLNEHDTGRALEKEQPNPAAKTNGSSHRPSEPSRQPSKTPNRGHKRSRSTTSGLEAGHKADLLKGLLVIASCAVLFCFDASRMYHSIRGQAAIKLYVIYNVLEVADRLLSAMGQDILECLFSSSVLARDANGRSLILRPFWMFCLALFYNVIHATALFYQVVTLNVAVNSYSNALLTLLMSNQFVEIKGTVFKKFEKENLFQLTCADVVERFQLWLMLTIIALRNVVEVGNLSISLSSILGSGASAASSSGNATAAPTIASSILPRALTVLPSWAGEVLGPFLIVLGSEMFVDWLKHAYISKFNNTKPEIYGRFLDVIAKDYYNHAFAEQNLTKRFGLPVLPLACLFIRAASQTYHMFLATYMPLPIPSTATSVSVESATSSPDTTAALAHVDRIFRRALGRSSFGGGAGEVTGDSFSWWSLDDVIAFTTMLAFFLICYFFLLAAKLLLGMALLSFARRRYASAEERRRAAVDMEGSRRVGGWGTVEVDEEKRRWIYKDDEPGLEKLRQRDERARREAREGKMADLTHVDRYQMVAKRIW